MLYEIPHSSQDVPGLEDYLRAVRERWQIILLLALAGGIAALAFANARIDTFEATSTVVINPTIANATNNNLVPPALEREREVIASEGVVQQALTEGGLALSALDVVDDLDVSFVNDSDTLSIAFQSSDPDLAADVVNLVAQAYVDRREAASLSGYTTQIDRLKAEASALTVSLEEIGTRLGAAQAQRIQAFSRDPNDPARQGLIEEASELVNAINTELTVARADIGAVNRDLREQERRLIARPPTAEVLRVARTPQEPSGISRTVLIAAGSILGAMAGAALAFTLQRLDRRAKGATEVEGALGTNVLGSIPTYGIQNRRNEIIMLGHGKGARVQRVRESYRRLRAALAFVQSTQGAQSFIITSALPGEGKSSTAANIAVAAAQAGSRVVLISADLRRPMQEKLLGVRATRGLSDYLADPTVSDIMVSVSEVPGLVLIPTGALPPNPGELLASSRFGDLVKELSEKFELVIIDTPPVLSTADAGSSSPLVDGVIVVVDSQSTDTGDLFRVRNSLEQAGGHIVGAVLNKDRSEDGVSLRKSRYSYERVASQR